MAKYTWLSYRVYKGEANLFAEPLTYTILSPLIVTVISSREQPIFPSTQYIFPASLGFSNISILNRSMHIDIAHKNTVKKLTCMACILPHTKRNHDICPFWMMISHIRQNKCFGYHQLTYRTVRTKLVCRLL